MAIAKPTVAPIQQEDLVRTSPTRINQNFAGLKATVDALIDVIEALMTAQGFSVDLYNDSYPPRQASTVVPNGLKVRVGPIPPSDALSRDTWIQTAD